MIHDPQTAQAFRLRRCAVRHLPGEMNLHVNAAVLFGSRDDLALELFPHAVLTIFRALESPGHTLPFHVQRDHRLCLESAIFERRGAGGNTQACGQQDRENESKLHVLTKNRSEA